MIGEAEKQAVLDVLEHPILVHGPRASQFEKSFAQFVNAPYAVAVSSCTAAMHLYYLYLELQKGEEVILPAQTHTATAHAIEVCGAKPVFVDSEINTGNIDIDKIEAKINEKTRAIAVVHYLGMPVDMTSICHLAQKYNLKVVEDCALSLGSTLDDQHTGLFGDIGCFSFYPVKHMTTAEGGMLITKNPELAQSLGLKKAFGVDRHMGNRKIPGQYDVIMAGLNYRMNEIQAAIGIEQLKHLDDFLKKREENYTTLYRALKGLKGLSFLQSSHQHFKSSYYALAIVLNSHLQLHRHAIIQRLKSRGIGTSIYYPNPVPLMTYYKDKYNYKEDDFPIATHLSHHSIALPVGPHLNPQDMLVIAKELEAIIEEISNG